MSLQAWYIFNNNYQNYGIGDANLTQVTAPVYSSLGKVSPYSFQSGTFKWTAAQTTKILNNETISIAFWIYPNQDTGSGSSIIFGNNSMNSGGGRQYTIFQYPTCNDFHWSWQSYDGSAYNMATTGILEGVLPSRQWTHVCITYDNPNGTIYINGNKRQTFSGVMNATSFNYETQVITSTGTIKYINDLRVYNHCLSDEEVREIAKALICHIPLDKINNESTVYDISGYGNHGTLSPTKPTLVVEAKEKYNASMQFNGSNNYIVCGRGPMGRDELTVNVWAYMDDWSTYTDARIASCTEGGGWNFEPNGGKIQFPIGTGASANTYQRALSSRTLASLSGWTMFTGIYDGKNVKIYINGELSDASTVYATKTPIYYHTSNGIFIGAEAGASATAPVSSYFKGKISDFRVYATALSADEVLKIYNETNHSNFESTVFTDIDSFNDISDLYIKEIHVLELQQALNKLNTYLPNADNCGYVNCCESCQNTCICQSDKCESCQDACTQCTDKCESCQDACTQCTDKCQSCQNACNQCTDKCQKCQNACNQCTDKCQKCQNTCNQCTDKCQSCQSCQHCQR